ncbi:MAG: FHA domain-containing protein [Anaerolineae bacterium]|nr:FHA domain-containing protein [Anaerolineae bacterium]
MDAPEETSARATWGPARIGSNTSIVLQVRDAPQPITLNPGQRMILGRSDPQSTVQPDVDMNPYGAVEKGVSRQHAILEFNEDTLMLLDAGSANGTFLNGQRLPPNQPRVVRDGDEVRLGKLVAYLYFK